MCCVFPDGAGCEQAGRRRGQADCRRRRGRSAGARCVSLPAGVSLICTFRHICTFRPWRLAAHRVILSVLSGVPLLEQDEVKPKEKGHTARKLRVRGLRSCRDAASSGEQHLHKDGLLRGTLCPCPRSPTPCRGRVTTRRATITRPWGGWGAQTSRGPDLLPSVGVTCQTCAPKASA